MEGVGDLVDVEPRSSMVQALGMDGKWAAAEEPLHWLLDSPDPVHSGNPDDRAARADAVRKTRTKGAGMGLPFAAAMVEATNVPVGLVCCAHGGTSMAQWDPAKKGEGGNSLYGSMMRQTELAGGKFKGLLWYQGESDAIAGAADVYPKVFADFIAAVRQDLNQPDLPFYLVQIGRFANPSDPRGWNQIQNAQRLIPDQIANTAVISVIDLPMDDAIHVGTQGLKRAGNRMANVVQHELFRKILGTTPTFDRVSRGPNNTLVVRFKGVNVLSGEEPTGLLPRQRIAGFSIRDAEGKEIPMIFEALGGASLDTVILKLTDAPPAGSSLWYGWGLNPYCNLVDSVDMAVPVFGPIGLDDVK
jgi:sialate O-acetylesterase